MAKTKAFPNAAKQACREHNVDVVVANHLLLNKARTSLRCDWLELMGKTGPMTAKLLESRHLLRRPKGLVFVDDDAALIEQMQKDYPDYSYVTNDLKYAVPEIQRVAKVGVYNIDGQEVVGGEKPAITIKFLMPLIQEAIERFHTAAFFMNNVLFSQHYTRDLGVRLRAHVESVVESFGGYAPRRRLDAYRLLPRGAEKLIEEGFRGSVGAFYVYQGKQAVMANLGVML